MKQNRLISVLIVNFNKGDVIHETIQSVLNQTYQNLQVIIIDDGSNDQSVEVIKDYSQKDSRIEYYINDRNRGVCWSTNFGFAKIRGEYLARIDSDDLWENDKLEKQMAFMDAHDGCRICFTGVDLIDEAGRSINEKESELLERFNTPELSREENLRYFFIKGNYLAHSTVMMLSSFQKQLGNFNYIYGQLHDLEYWVRAVKLTHIYKMQQRLVKMRRFSNKKNMSASTKERVIRHLNEHFIIRSHFFENLDDELFASAFRCLFRNPEASTAEQYTCEKLFLLRGEYRKPIAYQFFLGMLKAEECFIDPRVRERLEKDYNYTPLTYYKEMEKHMYYDEFVEDRLNTNVQEIAELNERIHKLKESLDELVKQHEVSEKEHLKELEHLKDDNEKMKRTLSEISTSTSWRLTAPVRKLLDTVKWHK